MNTSIPQTSVSVDLTGLPEPVVRHIRDLVQAIRDQQTQPAQTEPKKRIPLMGRLANLGFTYSKEEIDQAQNEAWKNFPRDFPGINDA